MDILQSKQRNTFIESEFSKDGKCLYGNLSPQSNTKQWLQLW